MDPLVHYFTNILDKSNLVDLATHYPGPTWRNGKSRTDGVSKCIDRFLASMHTVPILDNYKSWIHPS